MYHSIFKGWTTIKWVYNISIIVVTFLLLAYLIDPIFSVGYIFLVIFHEIGHLCVACAYNKKVNFGGFRPFGAFIQVETKSSKKEAAEIAIAGPFLGSVGATIVLFLFYISRNTSYLWLSYFTYIISLVNLIPIHPFDGGKVANAIDHRLRYIVYIFLIFLLYCSVKVDVLFYGPTMLLFYYYMLDIKYQKKDIYNLHIKNRIHKILCIKYLLLIVYILCMLLFLFYKFQSDVFFYFSIV